MIVSVHVFVNPVAPALEQKQTHKNRNDSKLRQVIFEDMKMIKQIQYFKVNTNHEFT